MPSCGSFGLIVTRLVVMVAGLREHVNLTERVNVTIDKWPNLPNYRKIGLKGEGSFGVVYEAENIFSGERVAIKFFKTSKGSYLSWKGASTGQRNMLSRASRECQRVKQIVESAEGQRDSVGASRLSNCIDDQVAANKDTGNIVYLVLELGGYSLADYVNNQRMHHKVDYTAARGLALELMEGLNLLSSFDQPYIHHDLKPDNLVYNEASQGGPPRNLKMIDFGGMFRACTTPSSTATCTGGTDSKQWGNTEAWRPPEYNTRGFVQPPSSFDMFSAGLVYMQLLCPEHQVEIPPFPAQIKVGTMHRNNIAKFLAPCLEKKDPAKNRIAASEMDLLALMLSSSMNEQQAVYCAENRPAPSAVIPVLQDFASGRISEATEKVAAMHSGHGKTLVGCHKVEK